MLEAGQAAPGELDSDDVDPALGGRVGMSRQVGLGNALETAALPVSHRLLGGAHSPTPPGLYLYEGQELALAGDDIDLPLGTAEVALQDLVPLGGEVRRRQPLAQGAQALPLHSQLSLRYPTHPGQGSHAVGWPCPASRTGRKERRCRGQGPKLARACWCWGVGYPLWRAKP